MKHQRPIPPAIGVNNLDKLGYSNGSYLDALLKRIDARINEIKTTKFSFDDSMSDTSENGVMNKVIKQYVDNKIASNKITLLQGEGILIDGHTISVDYTKVVNPIDVDTKGADKIIRSKADGKLDESLLPRLHINEVFPVNSEEEMLALDAQPSDMSVRLDSFQLFILKQSPASTLSNWVEIIAPVTGVEFPVTSVNGKVGVVVLNKSDIGLSEVDNTSDINKPISNPTRQALLNKDFIRVEIGSGSSGNIINEHKITFDANGKPIYSYTDYASADSQIKSKPLATEEFVTRTINNTITAALTADYTIGE